jgi:hypothetical protein
VTLLLPHQPDLRVGTSGPEIGNWQRFLREQGYRDEDGEEIVADESFGPKTGYATSSFRRSNAIAGDDPVVDGPTRFAAVTLGFVEFVQAAGYTQLWPTSSREITLVVIHTMECLETPEAAVNVALWFAGKTAYPAPKASAHYCLSNVSTIQCVRETDVAWHAKRANGRSVGIEHAGFAKQTPTDWADDYSAMMLARSAKLVARICRDYGIPIRRLSPDELRSNMSGICGHVDVTNAFDGGAGHQDPGPGFVWDRYLEMIASA